MTIVVGVAVVKDVVGAADVGVDVVVIVVGAAVVITISYLCPTAILATVKVPPS